MESLRYSDGQSQRIAGDECRGAQLNQKAKDTPAETDTDTILTALDKARNASKEAPGKEISLSTIPSPVLPVFRYVNPDLPLTLLSAIPNLLDRISDTPPNYRFATHYTIEEVMKDPQKAEAFKTDYLSCEAPYFSIARHPESGLTFDGISLNPGTGKLGEIRAWSAPSKECLDMGICLKALEGNDAASMVVSKDDPSQAAAKAAEILEKKIGTFERFYAENPGYGGFLPWFISGAEIKPTPDWENQVPGLDNGELAWTLLTAEQVLREKGYNDLADRYGSYNEILKNSVVKMFYDPETGKVRGDVKICDPHSPDSAYEPAPGKCDYLDGVHEGVMMLLYVSLFGKNLPEGASDRIWASTRINPVQTKWGTTWEAWAGSSHESWAHLFLPLRDNPAWNTLFRIREKIRTQNAAERGYPGLAASTNEPGGNGYFSACGIEGIGTLQPTHNDVFAIYGAFPLLLEFADKGSTGNYGYAWLLNMLKTQKMQGPLGGGESATNDGKKISFLKTMDGSFPNIIAMTGGLGKETARMLETYGLYDTFTAIVEKELKEGFGGEVAKEPVGFALPTREVPTVDIPDYEPESK